MKILSLLVVLALAFGVPDAHAAEAGIITIVEGPARVLRDTTWYKLVPGARFLEGDILEAKAAGQIQVELAARGTFNMGTPATLFAAVVPAPRDKAAEPVVLTLPDGWLKVAASAPATGIKVQFDQASLIASEAIALIHAQPGAVEMFVESGSIRFAESKPGTLRNAADVEMKAGEFATLSIERPSRFERRAPATFVKTIPRHLIDPLPALAAKYKAANVQLVAEREVTFAEAEPWLAGPYRKLFLKRFQPRLKDPAFRADVEARIARFPEWDPILHPDKYLPKTPVKAQ